MDKKLLITPVVTPLGLPSESELRAVGPDGEIEVSIGEGQTMTEELREGAPDHFHDACHRLLQSLSGQTDAILVGGTTGEGAGLGIYQYRALLTAMNRARPFDMRIMAGLLGGDEMVRDQVRVASRLGIGEFVLGLNHTGDNQTRFDNATDVLDTHDKKLKTEFWLYNMPTFQPASLKFIEKCLEDQRVVGIKDSSEGTDEMRLRYLLDFKSASRDFQVLAGNEEVYGNLRDPEYDAIDGLVSGNSNVNSELLRRFTDNPRNGASQERQEMHNHIMSLSLRRRRSHLSEAIEAHILGLKLKLLDLGIFDRQHVGLYSMKQGTLFQTYHKN